MRTRQLKLALRNSKNDSLTERHLDSLAFFRCLEEEALGDQIARNQDVNNPKQTQTHTRTHLKLSNISGFAPDTPIGPIIYDVSCQ